MEVVFRSIDKKFFIVDDNLTHQLKFNLNDSIGSMESLFEKTLKLYKRQKTFSKAIFLSKLKDLTGKFKFSVYYDIKHFEFEYYQENNLQDFNSRIVLHLSSIEFKIEESELFSIKAMTMNDLNFLAYSLFDQIQDKILKMSMGDVFIKLNESTFHIFSKNIIKSKIRK